MSQQRTFRDDVAELFKANPGLWIDGLSIAQIGGAYASRTRISECRTQLGMRIENRLRKEGQRTISEYRFTPPLEVLQKQAVQGESQGGVGA